MPLGVSHKWWLLPSEQQRVKSRNRQKRQLPVWVSHQWRLLFTQLRRLFTQLAHEVLLHLASRLVVH